MRARRVMVPRDGSPLTQSPARRTIESSLRGLPTARSSMWSRRGRSVRPPSRRCRQVGINIESITGSVARAASPALDRLEGAVDGARSRIEDGAGWAWGHKAEAGFAVATAGLLLSVPLTGGASGAAAGGLLATRGAAIAARIGTAGKAGANAVQLGRIAARSVQGARSSFAETRTGGALAATGRGVHAFRAALGRTALGRAMKGAEKPVTNVANGFFAVHFGETAFKYSKGDASRKDLALASLGMAPIGVAGVRSVAARRAEHANAQAAQVVSTRLDDVVAKAGDASDDASLVAALAPRANAPQTAGAAAAARDDAVVVTERAANVRDSAAQAMQGARGAPTATRLRDELDLVVSRAQDAGDHAIAAAKLAPDRALTIAARDAGAKLDDAATVARRTRREVARLARQQRWADATADKAAAAESKLGTAGLGANTVNNGVAAARERQSQGLSLTDGSFFRNLAVIGLMRTEQRRS